jgi:hypothetical protein
MGLGDEMVERARAEAAQSPASAPAGEGTDALRGEAAALAAALPEPPAYRRARDPAREKAQELLPVAVSLLSRAFAAAEAAPAGGRETRLAQALEAQVRALAAMAEGDIAAGDDLAREARALWRERGRVGALFAAGAPPTRKAFDREAGTSRYDPLPEPTLAAELFCPNQGCQRPSPYELSPAHATHRFRCARCEKPFTGHFVELRSAQARSIGSATHYALRVFPLGGGEATLEFDDTSGGSLSATQGDLLVLLYAGTGSLGAVENLSTGQVLWIAPKGACFLATAVYGEGAAELDDFRRFRDRVLAARAWGRALIRLYFAVGPSLARMARRNPALGRLARRGLEALRPRLP